MTDTRDSGLGCRPMMARTVGVQIDGRLFGAIAISEDYGFPCVVVRCRFRAVPAENTVAALKAARAEWVAHIDQMKAAGDEPHMNWRPDRDEIQRAYEATFATPKPRKTPARS